MEEKKKAKPGAGRPAQPKVHKHNQIEAIRKETAEMLKIDDETVPRTNEELLQFCRKILTVIQDKWLKDLRAVDTANTAILETNNGKQKASVTGLSKEDRAYILESITTVGTLMKALQADPEVKKDPVFQSNQQLLSEVQVVIPGFSNHKPI